ncbi:MAG: methylated-DNA--[protein]-cysteine S-methyltransferase [Bacilli bacterium]|nr:methylated-DNA--[protein]-cysteine S-methyltransferase [Bacilli bacterium]
MKVYDIYSSPIGEILIVMSDEGLCNIELFKEDWEIYLKQNSNLKLDKERCKTVTTQLTEYFQGKRQTFDVPLDIKGSSFQSVVWQYLSTIPYGKTCSYQDVANKIGNARAVRAIGGACKANPIPIIIPCHRVIGKNGKLIGYAGDRSWVKEWLLKHEEKYVEGDK